MLPVGPNCWCACVVDDGKVMDGTDVSPRLGGGVSKGLELEAVRRTVLFGFAIVEVDADRRGSRTVARAIDCRCGPLLEPDDEDVDGGTELVPAPPLGLEVGDLGRRTTCTQVSASCTIFFALSLEPSKNSRRS
jgi:hypothetical protein